MDEECKQHSGISARIDVLEEKWEARRQELVRVWEDLEIRLPAKIFWFFLSILCPLLGALLWTQISICSDLAVIKSEISHINQVQVSEKRIIDSIKDTKE